ncbi:extracellular solute-binding protein [Lentibacillus salicampi]|uniref:Extracellular solute-binding protein n=1 Tax=Lentibacillus salicampi TaxID=175306 RepID=A0A4Y9A8T0_9BACI|nr:extracellular solute-binding protein [Lentibacillus salicampi]TFJ92193.1 extracellular solute-binding protein [Lentibacillus salicampi]
MRFSKSLFMFVMLLAFIVGCSSDSGEESGNKELTWSTTTGYSPQSTTSAVADYISGTVEDFESEHSDISLNTQIQSSNISEAMARILEQANQDRAPDVAVIDSYLFPQYIEHLQPLDDLMEEKGMKVEDFLPFAQDVLTGPDGKVYGLYMSTDTRVLFYNSELIPEPPKTWEEVIEVGKKLKDEGYDGISTPGGRGEGTSVTTLWPLFWGQGGKLVDDEGNPIFGEGKNKEIMVDVLSTIQSAVEEGVLPQRVAGYGSENDQNEEIAAGNVGMFIGGNWQESFLKETLGEEEFQKWEVAPVPQLEGGERTTTSGGWAWGIFTDDPEKKQAAFDLVYNTFISEQGMGEFTSIYGELPSRTSVYESEHYEGTQFSDEYREMLKNDARVRPASDDYPEISNQLQIAISDVISGNKEPEQAVNDAWEVVNNE